MWRGSTGCQRPVDSPRLANAAERTVAAWTDPTWLWNRHAVARFGHCSLYAAGRVLRRLEREGVIRTYGDGRGPKGQLWQRVPS